MSDDCLQTGASLQQRFACDNAAVHVQYVEDIENDLRISIRATVLKSLKRRLSIRAQCDYLAIDYNRLGFQPQPSRRNSRIHARQVFVISGAYVDARPVLQQ